MTNGRGFVLVAVLWSLAGLSLLSAYIATTVEQDVVHAIGAKDRLAADLAKRSAEQTLLYLLSANPQDHKSVVLMDEQKFAERYSESGFKRLLSSQERLGLLADKYDYREVVVFSLQDESGLVSINSPQVPLLAAALRYVGMGEYDISVFNSRLGDYIDADHRARLNGAEYFEYRQAELPGPANQLLLTPAELQLMLGFDEFISPEQWLLLRPMLSVRQSVGVNVNLMSEAVLLALFSGASSGVERLLVERESRVLRTRAQIETVVGKPLPFDDAELRIQPSANYRLELRADGNRQVQVKGLALTPFGEKAPWRFDYEYKYYQTDSVTEEVRALSASLLQK